MSNLRKEKEREFFVQHMDTFKAIGLADPFFTIKTAFFQKGKFGRHSQFFEWELKRGEDIYIEFYDNVNTDGRNDIVPMNEDRQLFKLKYNPYFAEEYETKEGLNEKGETYVNYIIPVSEMLAVLPSGQEISYALYEKRREDAKLEVPQLQKSLSIFPDFEDEFAAKTKVEPEFQNTEIADAPLSEMTILDFAAIMLMKPVSARPWLNDMIKQTKSEI